MGLDVLAFSADQVRRLTGLSAKQLTYWKRTGFFVPEYSRQGRAAGVYSFRDLVGLYTVARLRKDYKFSLQELRPIGEYLHTHHDTPWASLVFYLQRGTRNFAFRDPERPEEFVGIRPTGQELIPFNMERIAEEVKDRVHAFRRRRPDQFGRIEKRRRVVTNVPVLAGTRVPTAAVWHLHKAGYTAEEIVSEYPTLTAEDVRAAIDYESYHRRKKATG